MFSLQVNVSWTVKQKKKGRKTGDKICLSINFPFERVSKRMLKGLRTAKLLRAFNNISKKIPIVRKWKI